MHALVIDDDKLNLTVLSQMLSMQGISTSTISAPITLDHVLLNLPPVNVVFLDLEMPKLDGYQVFARLKADPRFNGVPIVACTVHISEMSALRDLGFDSFIGKPINAEAFPDQIHQILNGKSVWAI